MLSFCAAPWHGPRPTPPAWLLTPLVDYNTHKWGGGCTQVECNTQKRKAIHTGHVHTPTKIELQHLRIQPNTQRPQVNKSSCDVCLILRDRLAKSSAMLINADGSTRPTKATCTQTS